MLVLTLIFMLVACNKDKNNNSDDNVELTDDMKQLVEKSREDIDAAFNYFLTAVEEGNDCSLDISFESDWMDMSAYLEIDDEYFHIEIYKSEAYAQKAYSSKSRLDKDVLVGDKIIYNKELYNQIIKSKRPSNITKFTQEQMQFMESKLHRGAGKNEEETELALRVYDEFNDFNLLFAAYIGGVPSPYFQEGYMSYNEADKPKWDSIKKLMSINYTDDSYFDIDKAAGTISCKGISKPGWHVEEITQSIWNDQTHEYEEIYTGKYEAFYMDLEPLPSTLTVPEKVGGYGIESAEVSIKDGNILESLVIEKEMSEVNLYGNIKQITIPKGIMLDINYNTALERINFGGTMDEWNALYGYAAQWWTKVTQYDYSTGERVEVTIDVSFIVVCTNDSITYPKA